MPSLGLVKRLLVVASVAFLVSASTARAEGPEPQPAVPEEVDPPMDEGSPAAEPGDGDEDALSLPHDPQYGPDPMAALEGTAVPPVDAHELPEDVDVQAAEMAPGPRDPAAYGEFLGRMVRKVRGKVLAKIDAKIVAGQEAAMSRLSLGLGILSMLGWLLLLSPVIYGRKYPGKGGVLLKYGAISSLMFFVTVNLFAGLFYLLRAAQGALGRFTNPQIAIVEAVFNVLERKADDFVQIGHSLVQPTLAQLAAGSDESPVVLLLENAKHLKGELDAFLSMARVFKSISFLFGYVPIVLTLVALATFVVAARPTLMQIVRLPATAAEGDTGAVGRVLKTALARIGRELVVTLVVIVVLCLVTAVGGLFLTEAIEPAAEALLSYLFASVLYVQLAQGASSLWILVSLLLTAAFLLLNVAAILVPSAVFVGKVQKLLQRRMHEREPFLVHMKFWCLGPFCLSVCLGFPMLFGLFAGSIGDWAAAKSFDAAAPNWPLFLTAGPATLCLSFIAAYMLSGGFFALRFLLRYKPAPAAPKAAPAVAAPLSAAQPA